jgi:hypothetical protein
LFFKGNFHHEKITILQRFRFDVYQEIQPYESGCKKGGIHLAKTEDFTFIVLVFDENKNIQAVAVARLLT